MKMLINALSIDMVKDYLERTGWYIDGKWELPATVWRLKDKKKYAQIILPNTDELVDYYQAMVRVLQELSEVEKRSIDDIVVSIQNREHINIRVVSEDVSAGEIPLSDGASLIRGAYDLVKSTAETLFKKSKDKTKKEQIEHYLRSVTLGQTEVGSYMVNVYSPKISLIDKQCDLAGDLPLMSSAIVSSLRDLKKSLNEYRDSDDILSLSKVRNRRQSESLCGALLSMGLSSDRMVEITVKNNIQQEDSCKISFDQEYSPILNNALRFYRDKVFELKRHEIVGIIIKLSRSSESDEGKITIQTYIDELPKNVDLTLSSTEYDLAIKMHEMRKYVVCVGDIQVKKRSALMTNVISFSEIPQVEIDIKE